LLAWDKVFVEARLDTHFVTASCFGLSLLRTQYSRQMLSAANS